MTRPLERYMRHQRALTSEIDKEALIYRRAGARAAWELGCGPRYVMEKGGVFDCVSNATLSVAVGRTNIPKAGARA